MITFHFFDCTVFQEVFWTCIIGLGLLTFAIIISAILLFTYDFIRYNWKRRKRHDHSSRPRHLR